jgi:hypothetical protein
LGRLLNHNRRPDTRSGRKTALVPVTRTFFCRPTSTQSGDRVASDDRRMGSIHLGDTDHPPIHQRRVRSGSSDGDRHLPVDLRGTPGATTRSRRRPYRQKSRSVPLYPCRSSPTDGEPSDIGVTQSGVGPAGGQAGSSTPDQLRPVCHGESHRCDLSTRAIGSVADGNRALVTIGPISIPSRSWSKGVA